YSRNASRHAAFFGQSTPLLSEQLVKSSRTLSLAEPHAARHSECFDTGAQSKKLMSSQARRQSSFDVSGVGSEPLLPPVSPPSLMPPHFEAISPQAVLFTQSIWYWYPLFEHSAPHSAFAPTGMRLQEMSLSHALEQLSALAPPPP